MIITKLDSARRQLLAAIHIQWFMQEPIAAYHLAANAHEIADALLKRRGLLRTRELIMEVHKISESEARRYLHLPRNFTKHADNDPDATLNDITETDADAVVLTACIDYAAIAGRSPYVIGLFVAWYAAINDPDELDGFSKEAADILFPNLRDVPRPLQIKAAREQLAKPVETKFLHDLKNEMTDNWRWKHYARLATAFNVG